MAERLSQMADVTCTHPNQDDSVISPAGTDESVAVGNNLVPAVLSLQTQFARMRVNVRFRKFVLHRPVDPMHEGCAEWMEDLDSV